MANCGKDILLIREGTEQNQRYCREIDPDWVKLNNFGLEEWMNFAWNFASEVKYFSVNDDRNPSGNWQAFFVPPEEVKAFIDAHNLNDLLSVDKLHTLIESKKSTNKEAVLLVLGFLEKQEGTTVERKDLLEFLNEQNMAELISVAEIDASIADIGLHDLTPHLALFVSFLKLLAQTQERFNSLTRRHLDFYFKKVLRLEKQAATPDTVHVLFELAKSATEERIEKSTGLDAGKDGEGKKLIFETTGELIANQATVSVLKSVYNDHDCAKLKAAETANSFDGLGGDFPAGEIKWWPFAYYEKPRGENEPELREYPELPDAKIGFAVSGEIFELREGERDVQLSLNLENALAESWTGEDLLSILDVFCTGEKGWLPAEIIAKTSGDASDLLTFRAGSSDDKKTLNIVFRIPKDQGALAVYNKKTHGENFNPGFPVCRVLIKMGDTNGHRFYRELVDNMLVSVTAKVYVKGIESLVLSNDFGDINPEKPFYPFTTQPVKRSKFNIDYPELFKKKWIALSAGIYWKNTPDDFVAWYNAYRNKFFSELSILKYADIIFSQDYKDSQTKTTGTEAKTVEIPGRAGEKKIEFETYKFDDRIIDKLNDFSATLELYQNEEWDPADGKKKLPLFEQKKEEDEITYSMNFELSNPNSEESNSGPVRLSLDRTFLHEMYPRLYAAAMSSKDQNVLIPNEPYTPFVERIRLSYAASATVEPKGEGYLNRDFDIYHEHPFGQAEENIEQKLAGKIVSAEEAKKLMAVPVYCKGGELYVGLENAKAQQNISLLFQVLEGSENPEADSFSGKQKVEWWVLCSNQWKQLSSTAIISNETDNLLKSGIFKFAVPKEASTNNTLLPPGYLWLRARIHKKYNAVSNMIGVHAQAVAASFENKGNELSHLENGLPAKTISKMIQRIPKVKSLEQPYSSFGGKPEESDSAYYRRVSERLRHKNRAITLWDYERLVLQNFPAIHKVKCLNHSCSKIVVNENPGCSGGPTSKRKTRFLAPGSVVVVVIPDIVNKNVFDIYQPRVSNATLNRIENYLKKLNSPLINTVVMNPEYEEVRVSLSVQFMPGHDELFYKKMLKQDLTRLLSPWAFDRKSELSFGVSLHKSVIIDFVEKLDYVDFVSDVRLYQKIAETGNEKEVKVATPSSPEVILVSSKAHDVKDLVNNCDKTKIEPTEECQK